MRRLTASFICVFAVWVQTTRCQILFPDQSLSEGSACRRADGTNGICKRGCPQPSLGRDNRNVCGFRGISVIICCPVVSKTVRKKAIYPFIEDVCEQRRSDDGQESRANSEYSHMVVLGWNVGSNETKWKCSGSLIHPKFVLTAATCFDNDGKPNIVRVGGLSLQEDIRNDLAVDYVAKDFLTHPGYRASELYNDIALLHVEKSSAQSGRITPHSACLFLAREPPTATLPAMGYATPGYGITNSYSLLRINVTLNSQEECENRYRARPIFRFGIIGSQICAHEPGTLRDPCEGDSGGAIQYFEDGVPYIFAIVSFGTKCLSGDLGVYSRISNHLQWIERMINETLT